MWFCPTCGNLLMVECSDTVGGGWRLGCQTCPYVHQLREGDRLVRKVALKRKQVDDILGGEEAWANVDKAPIKCDDDDCPGLEAYFFQAQLRSADEPMTIFYKCTTCGKRWKD